MKNLTISAIVGVFSVCAISSASATDDIEGVLAPQKDVIIKSSVDGVVSDLVMTEGAPTNKGDVIVKLQDDEQAAKVEVAIAAASATADASAAKIKANQASRKFNDLVTASKNGAATQWEVNDARSLRDAARFEYEQTQERIELDKKRLTLEEAHLRRYSFVAPFKGEIVDISVSPGESVSRGDTIVRVIDASLLELEAYVPAEFYQRLEEGRTYSGQVAEPFNQKFDAVLTHIDPIFEAATGAVRVVFTIDNKSALPAGASAKISLTPPLIMSLDLKNSATTRPPLKVEKQ